MKIAIMQPYFFPYIGYFQLVAAVDKFVFYDDVNFIKNGWINRNRVLLSGGVNYVTVPLSGASPFLKINQISTQPGERWRKKIFESIRHSYSKAPHFCAVSELVSEIIFSDRDTISDVAKKSIIAVADYLSLNTEFIQSSGKYGNSQLSGTERVIDICRLEKASVYYNLPGGKQLYNEEAFKSQGIDLRFVTPNDESYPQFGKEYTPWLSIIDVLMFNDPKSVKAMLFKEQLRE